MSPARRRRFFPIAAALAVAASASLFAHDLATSESTLRVNGRDVAGTLTVDLLPIAGVDANGNGVVTYEELDQSIAGVFAAVKEHYLVTAFQGAPRIVLARYELVDDHAVRLELAYTFPARVSRLEVTSTLDRLTKRPDHQHLVRSYFSDTRRDAVLTAAQPTVVFDDRFWKKLSVQLTAAGVALLGARVGAFVYQRRRRRKAR